MSLPPEPKKAEIIQHAREFALLPADTAFRRLEGWQMY
jgi:hypothetical protein